METGTRFWNRLQKFWTRWVPKILDLVGPGPDPAKLDRVPGLLTPNNNQIKRCRYSEGCRELGVLNSNTPNDTLQYLHGHLYSQINVDHSMLGQ